MWKKPLAGDEALRPPEAGDDGEVEALAGVEIRDAQVDVVDGAGRDGIPWSSLASEAQAHKGHDQREKVAVGEPIEQDELLAAPRAPRAEGHHRGAGDERRDDDVADAPACEAMKSDGNIQRLIAPAMAPNRT